MLAINVICTSLHFKNLNLTYLAISQIYRKSLASRDFPV